MSVIDANVIMNWFVPEDRWAQKADSRLWSNQKLVAASIIKLEVVSGSVRYEKLLAAEAT